MIPSVPYFDVKTKILAEFQICISVPLKVLKTEQIFIKIFASSEPTLLNLEVIEVKKANVENLNFRIINRLY